MVTVFADESMSTAFSNGRLPFCSLVDGGRTRTATYSDVVSGLSEAASTELPPQDQSQGCSCSNLQVARSCSRGCGCAEEPVLIQHRAV